MNFGIKLKKFISDVKNQINRHIKSSSKEGNSKNGKSNSFSDNYQKHFNCKHSNNFSNFY